MKSFNPIIDINNAAVLVDSDGEWPSFHDSELYSTYIWNGDLRPDDNIWIGPEIITSIGILGPKGEMPYAILKIKFKDCDLIRYSGPGLGCPMIYDLEFSYEERGFLNDGITPLTPYIHVLFKNTPDTEPLLSFRCMSAQGISREPPNGSPYA